MTKRERTKKMNTNMNTVKETAKRAMRSATLSKALREWFNRKGACPDPEVKEFREWVERRADQLAADIRDDKIVNADNLFIALQVQAIGDSNAIRFAAEAARDGFNADTNCYVEEGMVHANVWLEHKLAACAKARAEKVAEEFRKMGYSSEVWVDELDDTNVTVYACLDFPLYVELAKKGGR